VRTFVQDDAHIFCRPDQIQDEVTSLIRLVQYVMEDVFGFQVSIDLSLRGDKRIGSDEVWDVSEDALRQALLANGLEFREAAGEGAFYGPKIDFQVTDAIGRKWQLSTIQCDFNMPERFGLHYTTPEGTEARPVVIHRAILGSIERFMGILVEHYAGRVPDLARARAVRIVPVSDAFNEYAGRWPTICATRAAHVDERREGVGYKIRDAEMQKVPYMVVVGGKEVGSSKVSVRSHAEGELGQMDLDHFVSRLRDETKPPAPRTLAPTT
jgi:threonyl-tRNA synthetase